VYLLHLCFYQWPILLLALDVTLNFIVLFALLFGLGIIVDDAIVVIENTHRIYQQWKSKNKRAKEAAGEVFIPVLAGTLNNFSTFLPTYYYGKVLLVSL
jgi:multidrug efflux pump